MTQEDSVRRLAEADAHALREQAEAWAEEHYLHDSVGAFEAGWEARQPAIDSLTTERDQLRLMFDTEHRVAAIESGLLARAEAAEADRERLREALSVVHECAEKRLDDIPPYPKRIDEMNEAEVAIQNVAAHCCGALVFIEQYARAALATPPSEGQS